jgi:polyhydroxyalkanoate synthesis regulator phasin
MAEPKATPGSGIADALRRYVDSLVEMSQTTRERAERIVDDLAKRGEPVTKDFQRAARELVERSARNQRELASLVQKEFRRLTARNASARSSGSGTGAKQKPSAKKKPAAKRAGSAKRTTPKKASPARTRKSTTNR